MPASFSLITSDDITDVLSGSSKDTLIRIWKRSDLTLFTTLQGHEGPVNAVGLQDDKVVSASGDGKMMLWDIASGQRIRTFEGHDRGLACIEFQVHSPLRRYNFLKTGYLIFIFICVRLYPE